jgi:hypothetical protein
VQWNPAAALVLGGMIAQLNCRPDTPAGLKDHGPRKVGDLPRPKTSFGRQKSYESISVRVSGAGSIKQQVAQLIGRKNFCLLSSHLNRFV